MIKRLLYINAVAFMFIGAILYYLLSLTKEDENYFV